ncbi:caspase recruitment domain-containing protein 10 isoform X2 [Poeciliopsis prolifica]|uniref:caspase recruitment domain-containing protein 10 isoform X2 n=1 Tax=Poeciliopsis prolifica TaxID=188132 RepID=UPI002413A5C1|nr:caspase recruitment domain-containing protein 10 isoform X2 [Poeciliopsis prolifica]
MSGDTDWLEGDGAPEEPRSTPQWSEQRCEELWERVEGVRHKLTRILNPAKLTPYLRQCKVIDGEDEDEVLNSTQYPLRISKAGRLLDILRAQGQRGLQAFMESLEFYHPEQYTQLTGKPPTHRCSLILDEEGPEGLTQFLLLEVRKLREQLRNSRMCERRLSQRCRMAEEERSRAEHKAQELRHDKLLLERLRQDWESASRELGKLKDRHLEQAVKYSRALEEQGKASSRERELLRQVQELKSRLAEADKRTENPGSPEINTTNDALSNGINGSAPERQEEPPPLTDAQKAEKKGLQTRNSNPSTGVIALMDILEQDRREAAEQRQELGEIITRLQGELQATEDNRAKLEVQCEQLRLKVRTLQLDWETEQKRSLSYFNQTMELEKERDQALRSRDSLQLEYTDCLLDKNRLRKCIAELQANLEQQQRELERERERCRDQMQQSSCLNCSHLSLCSEDRCFGPCCSLDLDLSLQPVLRKTPPRGQNIENSEGSVYNSEENLLSPSKDNEKEINRLSTFPFPPCVNSINRRFNTEFDVESWGSDENDNIAGEQTEPSLWDSWTSLHSHLFPPDLVNLPPVPSHPSSPNVPRKPPFSPSSSPSTSPKLGRASLADDITIVGGNRTGIFVSHVKAGSPAEQCGLKEGCELLELDRVLFGGASVQLAQCTAEVAHFSLQCWTEPSSLKHQSNPEGYSKLRSEISSPSFAGADSFYARVNLNMEPHGDPSSLGVSCDDIIHVTDTRHNGRYQWRCSLVNRETAVPLQTGTMPNYNRAQQLLLIKLRKMSVEQKDVKKKMFVKKTSDRVRLVKAVDPNSRGSGSSKQIFYTLSKRHEDHLIPYSLVKPVKVQTKRPVIFSPSLLSRRLIERLLQPAESGLNFSTCPPEPIQALEQKDKRIFLLDSCSPEQALGIRLESIQDVISQGRHCLLELGLPSVEALLRQGIYPIVIHIRPKNKKHKKLRKFFPRCGEDSIMEEVCHAEELQLETLPLLCYTVEPSTWSCTEELLQALRDAVHRQQKAVAWVELDRLQ